MKTAHTVLVADRSRNSLRLLVETLPLVFPDWRVMGASTYLEVEELQRAHLLDLIILDTGISSTGRDSVELIRHWRNGGACTPIAASTMERALAPALWEAGVDEVLFKPWESVDLPHRLGRLVHLPRVGRDMDRRPRADGVSVSDAYTFGPVLVTPDSLCFFPDGGAERLGVKEYGMLGAFAGARGRLLVREELLRQVWGGSASVDSNSVNVYLSRLRRLFANHGVDFNALVVTEAKLGWRIAPS